MGETGKHLFRAANVWWRCACLKTIDVCIWGMFVFMPVVVTVYCVMAIVEDSVF